MRWFALWYAVAAAAVAVPVPALAQDDAALAAARQRFTQAVADEDAKRYEAALAGFRAVAVVKDTANVRYRIASCLEALSRPAEALANYEAAVHLGAQDTAGADAVQASRTRAAQLDAIVARLTVVLPPDAPAGVALRVDDVALDPGSLGSPVPLDPGHHTLSASAPGRTPFETAITLSSGGRVSITVSLPPAARSALPPSTSQPAAAPSSSGGSVPVGAWIAVGVGGALAVGSALSFVLRASNLSTINGDCTGPSGGPLTCNPSKENEVNSAHDAAQIEGPLGIGLAAGAAVSLGIGAWLFAAGSSSPAGALVVLPTGPGFVVRGSL